MVHADCHYAEDMEELTAGTLCQCQCGEKAVWRDRPFHGNVVAARERECLEDICPRVSPTPGLKFDANCRYDPGLYGESGAKSRGEGALSLLVVFLVSGLAWRAPL